jgi:prepilin-type N-terminal cleavage/methylation domain-containing protein/prepilin-type processing-associated H-X9-DG protein
MELCQPTSSRRGFTLIELLVVVAVIMIIFAMMFPVDHGSARTKAKLVECQSNLRQIAIGSLIYATDHQSQFPTKGWIVEEGDSMGSNDPTNFFLKISSAVATPRCFWCPLDFAKSPAKSYSSLICSNISYFVNLDACQTNMASESILAGDRFLNANGKPVQARVLFVGTNTTLTWLSAAHAARGNLVFADGHTQLTRTNLNLIFQSQPAKKNRLVVP